MDLLESDAVAHVAHVATIGPEGEPQNNPVWFDWDGENHKPGDERVVVFVRPQHTTQKDG
jgi:hypothetical protein